MTIGIDYGKSFLKACHTITDHSYVAPDSGPFKFSGGRKTALAAVCQAPETVHNLQVLANLIRLSDYADYTFAGAQLGHWPWVAFEPFPLSIVLLTLF